MGSDGWICLGLPELVAVQTVAWGLMAGSALQLHELVALQAVAWGLLDSCPGCCMGAAGWICTGAA